MAVAEPEVAGSGPSEGARLRARGVDIDIAGESHRLVFSYEAILLVEEEYGSLQAFLETLATANTRGPRFKALTWGITASLLHEQEAEMSDAEIQELRRRVVRGLNSRGINDHLAALTHAIEEGLPEADKSPKGKGSRGVSRGNGSTTSRASALNARIESSGA